MTAWRTILSGIVGSTAYGLAGPGSDVDRIAFAAAPTTAFHGFDLPIGRDATRATTKPDVTIHEIGKALSLLLSCNPTVNEVLYLPDELIEVRHPLADELIGMRASLLHARGVRSAYLGYSHQQFTRLRNRANGAHSLHTENRMADREDLLQVSAGQACDRVRRESTVRGRPPTLLSGMPHEDASGGIRQEPRTLPRGDEEEPQASHAARWPRLSRGAAQASPEGQVRNHPGGLEPFDGTAERRVSDLRFTGRSGGSLPHDRTGAGPPMSQMQSRSGSFRGQSHDAGEGTGVSDQIGDEVSPEERTRRRVAKHARHLWRLCQQAQQLHVTGTLTVQLAHPEICREFGERIVSNPERGLEVAETLLAATAIVLDSTPSALPAEPDMAAAEAFLIRVRAAFYQPPED
jgi:hypothetical protein